MRCRALLIVLSLLFTATARAQTGDGSLRGYVRDESGAVLPGVTVTAASDVLISPITVVSDATGYYRVPYLPPGEYRLTFELSGFSTTVREGIGLRAGANFAVDIVMKIGAVQETITVTAETPMLEVAKPSNVLNVEGEFQRDMPLQARRNWSDFLELTPGVHARPFDDNSGRMVYFGHGADLWANVIQLEGMVATANSDAQAAYVGMGADMIEDVQVKTGGVDAASPTSTGLVINVVTPRGGNRFSGAVGYAFQPFQWNADNAPTEGNFAGTPTTQKVSQLDVAWGGPIVRDKAWFFGSFRLADLANGISRTPQQLAILESFSGMPLGGGRGSLPDFEPFDNVTDSFQPYVKLTFQIDANHELSGFYQRDDLSKSTVGDSDMERFYWSQTGGNLYGAKLTSIWGTTTTSQITVGYNDKTAQTDIAKVEDRSGPEITIHESFVESGGELIGTGALAHAQNARQVNQQPSSIWMIRADLTHYKEGWAGSHEFQMGVFLQPSNKRDVYVKYSNFQGDGWFSEEHRLIDPDNLALGTVPFMRVRRDVESFMPISSRDRDLGIYFQDSWKPSPRLTLNLGLRVDFVNRYDALFDFTRMNTTVFGPRAGFSFLVTEDARNVLRGSVGRIHEAVNGRDAASTYAGSAGGSGGRTTRIEQFDREGDGVWETEIIYPPTAGRIDPSIEFDSELTQPHVDEYIVGFRKQFPGLLAVDAALIHRRNANTYALLDVNGIYPDGPHQSFVGFGLIDPNYGILYQQTNNSWSKLIYTALEITVTKRLSRSFQAIAGFNRQWHHISGTWNPGDPARFIQPDHFANNKAMYMPRGNNEHNSLRPGSATSYAPTWREYSIRLGGTYYAPGGITLAASYTQNAGPWSGPLIDRLPRNNPDVTQYGPPRIRLENGLWAPNPLATVFRMVGEDRADGQVQAPPIKSLGLKIGKRFRWGSNREIELAANIFNVFNWGNHHQYTYAQANAVFSPNFLQMQNLQLARALQLTAIFRY